MRFAIRPLRGRWPAALERTLDRFFWDDPRVIMRDDVTPEEFRRAMSAMQVGETIKITGSNRHPWADELILKHVDLSDLSVVDVGASDGSTSLDLIRRLPSFARYTIADRYLHLEVMQVGRHHLFYGPDGELILIVGPRALAWPAQSRLVRAVYTPVLRRALADKQDRRPVLLLNPEVQTLIASDPRIAARVHDIFEPWPADPPTVIKVANVLRRLYFSDEQIARALRTLLGDLPDGGYLLIVDNPRIVGIDERSGLYRRTADRFAVIEESTERPEIGDLVLATRADGR